MRLDKRVKRVGATKLRLDAAMGRGLELLLEAYEYARELEQDCWEFAIEVAELRQVGLSGSKLRWLLSEGYVEHGVERTRPRAKRRGFVSVANIGLPEGSCFVLTEAGAIALRSGQWRFSTGQDPSPIGTCESDHQSVRARKPTWDGDRRELRLGNLVVKRFKNCAPNQETILAALQEERWPVRIDDPLPGRAEQDPNERLHDAIKNLNRHQVNRLVRFHGDGSRCGVRWMLTRNVE